MGASAPEEGSEYLLGGPEQEVGFWDESDSGVCGGLLERTGRSLRSDSHPPTPPPVPLDMGLPGVKGGPAG